MIATHSSQAQQQSQRIEKSLNGPWQFRREGTDDPWKTVTLPNNFEQHEGESFDGIGIYKKTIPPFQIPKGTRVLLHFQAVATHAEVWFNGKKVGTHLGGWTPFRFDVTERVKGAGNTPHEIRVRVDEKVGHNSQGFLPVFAPHFGGIWQDVKLLFVPPTWIDETGILAVGDPQTGHIRLEIPIIGASAKQDFSLAVRHRLRRTTTWSNWQKFEVGLDNRQRATMKIPVPHWQLWSPAEPNLYELEIGLQSGDHPDQAAPINSRQRVVVRAGFRTIEVEGHKLLLNGKPLVVRGVLNWGYAPPRLAPSIDEEHFRSELEFARAYGFNLMKFCLWVPPSRYLEIADEMGMLTWIEYPTWHSKWTPNQLPTLRQEFAEFFRYDRNHPSVVLRSLTCETGLTADLNVIRNLYDLCHEMVPGSVVEDDSSWIAWNRVHDFYDDHPYGNNHTWVKTLDRLKDHIREHGVKPLVLGEAIAADTWADPAVLLDAVADERPFWLPNFLEGNREWMDRVQKINGEENDSGLDQLKSDSKHYAWLMRKYQIETYRREVPHGGYVVSVIRDFPFAGMGLVDFLGRPKWSPSEWDWHRDTMLLLATELDRRSYTSGEHLRADLLVSHFGNGSIHDGRLRAVIERGPNANLGVDSEWVVDTIEQPAGTLAKGMKLDIPLPDVDQPTQLTIRATLTYSGMCSVNDWQIWVMPRESKPEVVIHPSIEDESKSKLFENRGSFPPDRNDEIVVAVALDRGLIDFLEAGGRVLLLPTGKKSSLPLSNEWFLRGGPYIPRHPLLNSVPRELLVELQHFDLAGPVVPDIDYLEQIDPILMLWHNHDIRRVKTHGLLFETRIGQGRLLVSALRHDSKTNSAGRWILHALVDHLTMGKPPRHAFSQVTIDGLRERVDAKKIDLSKRTWLFLPDPENNGLANQWHAANAKPEESWNEIRIGQAWEGQGYPELDGWAWYRISVDIPADWNGRPIYVSLEGIDDHYELYVNGGLAGSGGDIETQTTAFEERCSHDITSLVQPGEIAHIVFRVYDWYGAGGIHRPVTLGTAKIGTGNDILK